MNRTPLSLLVASLVLSLPLCSSAAPVTLQQVLDSAGDSHGHSAANARFDAYYAAKEQREDEAGWEWFGSANVGKYHELVTDDLRDNYYGRNYAIGLRYPLLGTLRRQAAAVRSAERDTLTAQIDADLERSQQRLALRSAYADWWRAQQESELCANVEQAAKSADMEVSKRLQARWIRPSQAELIRSEWSSVRARCSLQKDLLQDTRTALESLGASLGPNDTAVAEPLANQPGALADWRNVLENHPRLERQRADLSYAEQQRERPWYAAIESDFTVAATREDRSGASRNGDGLTAGISVSAPFDLLGYGNAQKREGEALYRSARESMEAERSQLVRDLGAVLTRLRRSLNEYKWRAERRIAVDAILAEERQRGALNSASDSAVNLLQAQVDRYNAGFAMISAWHGAWVDESALRLFGDDSPAFAALLGSQRYRWTDSTETAATASTIQTEWLQGAYIWDSAALLDTRQQLGQLAALRQANIQLLYVGINATQVADGSRTRGQLQALLTKAHAQGMKVQLLLGDPDWMKPQERNGLIQLIRDYGGLPFDGLHLDLEVEQLGWPVPDQRLRDWISTLQEVKSNSRWPVSISSHPRWFSEMSDRQPCVPCALEKLELDHISVMIYTRNPERSASQAEAIARRWPSLAFRLAQSIEPDQPRDLSWADASASALQRQSTQWQQQLGASGIGGIDWQSWTYYPRTQ